MTEEFDTSGLVKEYIDDARGHLDRLDSSLLDIERYMGLGELDVYLVSDLLGALHTLKGNSGMMGFTSLQQYVHRLEGVFKSLLDGSRGLTGGILQRLFESAAYLRGTLDLIEKDPKSPPDMSEGARGLEDAEGGDGAGRPKAARPGGFGYIGARSSILKVDFERLDHLLNLAGELVTHKTRLAGLDERFRKLYGDEGLGAELSEVSALIHKASSDLQEAIMKVRMLPIRHVFQRFPRMVRDLAHERGKEINLAFAGESTELDKTVIDMIGEPLVHLIRNAVDHGIEAPDERLARGKSAAGSITLSAAQEGNHIIITVADDGAGIDIAAVKARAAARPGGASDAVGREDPLELIFTPGLSTAKEVTEVSGRGVGLDVVKKNVAKLGGVVDVDSSAGRGTAFTIRLPLTLAIISALLVGSGAEVYALPLSSVIESLRLDPGLVRTVNGREVLMLRDRVLPLVRLRHLFQTPALGGDGRGRPYVVVVGGAEKRVGLVVDRLMGSQEIVIKALDDYLGENDGVAGATIQGDGSVVLILDVAGLIEKNLLKGKQHGTESRRPEEDCPAVLRPGRGHT